MESSFFKVTQQSMGGTVSSGFEKENAGIWRLCAPVPKKFH